MARGGVAAAALGTGAAAGCAARDWDPPASRAAPQRFDPHDWASVRGQFAADAQVRQFAAFLLASHPRPVRDAIERHRAGLDANAAQYLRDHAQVLDAAVVTAAAAHLGADADEVALTDSTTMGLGLLYGGLRLGRHDEVLTSAHDFYSTHEALRLRGLRTRRVRLYGDPAKATAAGIVAALRRGIRDRTRVLALTWVHSSTGVKLPVRAIGEVVSEVNRSRRRDRRLFVVLDSVHALGAEPAPVADLGCDALVAGTHKWLLGPRGTGIVWARRELWRLARSVIPSFDGGAYGAWLQGRSPAGGAPGALHTPGGYHSFEHRWALADAFKLNAEIGQDRIGERIAMLATRLKRGLASIPGVRVVTPMAPELSAGLVCVDIRGVDPADAVRRLRDEHRVMTSTTPYATRYLRLVTGIHLSEEDVDAAVAAVRAIA